MEEKSRIIKRRKPAAARKAVTIRLRVTAEQRRRFEAAAAREGLAFSQWARRLLLRASANK
jgi:hypothetical protein